jgi:hypothetical protein
MLDFIWRLRGSVSLEHLGTNDEVVLDHIERLLDKQRKDDRERGQNSVVFEDPLWSALFGRNWLAMVIYDRGRFWIEQGLSGRRLRYDLRSLHGMVFCLFGALMFFFFGLADGGFLGGLEWAAGVFAWLYGMNVLLALARVPWAIHKAVRADQR